MRIFELQLEREYKMLVTILWSNKHSRNVITSNKGVVDIFRAFVSTTWTISQEFPVIAYITIENQSVGDGVTDAVPANQCNIAQYEYHHYLNGTFTIQYQYLERSLVDIII